MKNYNRQIKDQITFKFEQKRIKKENKILLKYNNIGAINKSWYGYLCKSTYKYIFLILYDIF